MRQTNFVFVIPTFTNIEGRQGLLGLIKQWYPHSQSIIVNNNPKKNIEASGQVTVIQNGKNEGFAAACNTGAIVATQKYNPKYIVFLNDDVSFDHDWVNVSINQLVDMNWSAISPVLKNLSGKIENCGYRVLPHGKIELITDLNSNERIDGISATALIIKTEVFHKLEGFDSRFFAYLEDVDLSLRMNEHGYKFGIAKHASVIHEGQVTSSKFPIKKALLDTRNWMLIIAKHWNRKKLLKHGPSIALERVRNVSGVIKSLFS